MDLYGSIDSGGMRAWVSDFIFFCEPEREQDGMEAIKRLDARGALDAFETALRMDNEVCNDCLLEICMSIIHRDAHIHSI